MKRAAAHVVVFVTAPDLKVARRVAKAVLKARAAACVNLVPRIESHYWWRGRIEKGAEVLLVIKTASRSLPALEQVVMANHPFETPEFVVLPIQGGSVPYLQWLDESVSPGNP